VLRPYLDERQRRLMLAVEVADSSLGYDLGRKARVYAEFGARELWVINAARRLTHVHVDPGPAGYSVVTQVAAAERLMPAYARASSHSPWMIWNRSDVSVSAC
jgi:hypothetical protein